MNFNITTMELWFWRIGIVVCLALSVINYNDNRQQDKLIFKSVDSLETQTGQIHNILQIESTNQEAIMQIQKYILK